MRRYMKIHPDDLVAVALTLLKAGTVLHVDGAEVTLREDIHQGHKFALTDIPAHQPVIKYGAPIGVACEHIPVGGWVHTHNLKTGLGDLLSYQYQPNGMPLTPADECYFQGYCRSDGSVGVRNEIWIIPTVGCANSIAAAIERQAQRLKTDAIDCIAAFPHPYGCSQMGEDQENTRRILANLIQHPTTPAVCWYWGWAVKTATSKY